MDCAHTDGLLYGQYEARNQPVEGRHNIIFIITLINEPHLNRGISICKPWSEYCYTETRLFIRHQNDLTNEERCARLIWIVYTRDECDDRTQQTLLFSNEATIILIETLLKKGSFLTGGSILTGRSILTGGSFSTSRLNFHIPAF